MQTDSMREQLVTQAILTLQGSLYRLAFSYVHDPDEAMDLGAGMRIQGLEKPGAAAG